MRTYYVYILSDRHRRLLYTGVTNQLERRLHEHRTKLNPQSYTARYDITYLVYFERHAYAGAAYRREKEIKQMSRWEREQLIRQFEAEERSCPAHLKNPYAPPGRQASAPLGPLDRAEPRSESTSVRDLTADSCFLSYADQPRPITLRIEIRSRKATLRIWKFSS